MPLNRNRTDKQVTTVYPRKRACELLGGYSIPRLNAAIEQFAVRLAAVPDRWDDLSDEQRQALDDLLYVARFDWMQPDPTAAMAMRLRMMGHDSLAGLVDGWSADERLAVVFRHARKV